MQHPIRTVWCATFRFASVRRTGRIGERIGWSRPRISIESTLRNASVKLVRSTATTVRRKSRGASVKKARIGRRWIFAHLPCEALRCARADPPPQCEPISAYYMIIPRSIIPLSSPLTGYRKLCAWSIFLPRLPFPSPYHLIFRGHSDVNRACPVLMMNWSRHRQIFPFPMANIRENNPSLGDGRFARRVFDTPRISSVKARRKHRRDTRAICTNIFWAQGDNVRAKTQQRTSVKRAT